MQRVEAREVPPLPPLVPPLGGRHYPQHVGIRHAEIHAERHDGAIARLVGIARFQAVDSGGGHGVYASIFAAPLRHMRGAAR
jgi:hypothetical protein